MTRTLLLFVVVSQLLFVTHGDAGEKQPESFDATIDFEADNEQRPTTAEFRYNGKPIGKGQAGLEAIVERVSQLPPGTSIVWAPNYDRCGACSGSEPRCIAEYLYPDVWKKLEAIVAERKLTLSSSYPYAGPTSIAVAPAKKGSASLSWSNYRGPGTPHEDVLYVMNGKYIGRGDDGLDGVIKQLDELPVGTELHMPTYKYSGRWAFETFSDEELEAANRKLRNALPFLARKQELGKKITERKLKLVRQWDTSPQGENPTTAIGWHSADRYGHTFVASGRIVRHDAKSRAAKAVLAWEADAKQDSERQHDATITLNGKELGKGTPAFAKAMDELALLPAGSVIHVRVCLRTKGPFLCPLSYEGHRHFERTGYEPYVGLYPWLLDVAEKRKLEIEWIPDEGKSIGDCPLNR